MSNNNSRLVRWIQSTTTVKDNELAAASLSFAFVFILMMAYYILRPLRDAMASDWTDAEVSFLWTLNFFISTALVAVFGLVVSRIEFNKLVPFVYAFFAASFVLFYLTISLLQDGVLIDKAFYLWVSVFALFHVSVFWSFMADTFNKEQAGRLFAIIATGASLGAIAGPLISGLFAQDLGIRNLMLIAAGLLLVPIPIIWRLSKLKRTELNNEELQIGAAEAAIGGNPFGGFKEFFTNPYLLGIGVFILLYTGINSFVYLEQKNLLEVYDMETRTSIYGYRDAILNTLTYFLAFFVTGRLVSKLGMGVTLPLVPLLIVAGMLVLAISPILLVAVGLHVVLKAGNYGLTRPAREMLFTLVDRESRFKAKPVIDIVAYRGSDVIMAWFFTGLTQGLGLGLAAVAAVGALIAALWVLVGYFLGRYFDRHVEPERRDSVLQARGGT
ncbi:MAG TPA: MFS transporter [Woeseiaceae bacterium]|nr:MFS transporter [Woeseiaceae bacterium]